jgi:hypothetical protein
VDKAESLQNEDWDGDGNVNKNKIKINPQRSAGMTYG